MTHRLTTNYAKNYCNRTLIVKVIVENVVTCFLLGHSVVNQLFHCLDDNHNIQPTVQMMLKQISPSVNVTAQIQ